MIRLLHSGDIGDAIAAMPIVRHLGGGSVHFTQGKNPRPFQTGAAMLKPLFERQGYITSANWDLPKNITHDLSGHWRQTAYKPTRTLAESQAAHLGLGVSMEPWIDVSASPVSEGKIVIARSKRYNNPKFPWRAILQKFRASLLFIGLPDEKVQLERMVGWQIPHYKVPNFLIMAEVIKGSLFFIGNQSSPGWLAMGMGHPMVQETSPGNNKDSMVARFNASFIVDGRFPFDNLPHLREFHPNYEI